MEKMTDAEKALTVLQNRLELIYDLCCGTAPKQSVGELIAIMREMPEWGVVSESLVATPRFLDLAGTEIDLRRVTHVGKLGGDQAWMRYNIHMDSGATFEICEQRRYVESVSLPQMPRSEFVALWKSATTAASGSK